MNICPITYQILTTEAYSKEGLRGFSPTLKNLYNLDLTAEEQRQEAVTRSVKMSVQGMQPKISARLNSKLQKIEIVDSEGQFILKPQSDVYKNLPENEDLTMKLARIVNIETPFHGMLYSKDNSLTYFIKRFDRITKKQKLAVEDFAQLTNRSRETKYQSSIEQIVTALEEHCTFPLVEKSKLFQRIVFCFLVGNEDMHLKNFSLITRGGKIELSPAYDLVNTTLAIPHTKEELALPLNGKKRNLQKNDFISYFAGERLGLNDKTVLRSVQNFSSALPIWKSTIDKSFLPTASKKLYLEILNERASRLLIQ